MDTRDRGAIAEAFDRDGYVIVRGLFDASRLAEVESEIVRYVEEVAPTPPAERVIFEPGPGSRNAEPAAPG